MNARTRNAHFDSAFGCPKDGFNDGPQQSKSSNLILWGVASSGAMRLRLQKTRLIFAAADKVHINDRVIVSSHLIEVASLEGFSNNRPSFHRPTVSICVFLLDSNVCLLAYKCKCVLVNIWAFCLVDLVLMRGFLAWMDCPAGRQWLGQCMDEKARAKSLQRCYIDTAQQMRGIIGVSFRYRRGIVEVL